MEEMMVATCQKCRAAYNMDMEDYIDDLHFNPRTGEECYNDDSWSIKVVPYRNDWRAFN